MLRLRSNDSCTGINLTDLTFVEEGNKDVRELEGVGRFPLINIVKMRCVEYDFDLGVVFSAVVCTCECLCVG